MSYKYVMWYSKIDFVNVIKLRAWDGKIVLDYPGYFMCPVKLQGSFPYKKEASESGSEKICHEKQKLEWYEDRRDGQPLSAKILGVF